MSDNIKNRLNRIIWQIEWIKKMLSDDKDCDEIAIQFKASISWLQASFREFANENAKYCIERKDSAKISKFIEIMIKN